MITLSQAERLVRKIDELVGRPGLEAQAAKLAQDYAELGRAANRRLEQCAAMIENGEDLQALQLAETQPQLLDLVTLLSFRQAKEWRDYCQSHNLPLAEPFYDKHVRLLNATYGKGLASDQSFYRDYRRAVMKGDEPRALSILRVIARLNPSDKNTAQELQRLEEKAVEKAMDSLRQIVATNDAAATMAALTQLETSALKIPANHPVWLKAHVVQCQELLRQAQGLRERDAWEETAALVEEIRGLANQNDVPLSAADTQVWNDLEAWTSSRRAALVQEQDFQHAAEALQYQVETVEHKLPVAGRLTVQQLQADLNQLRHKRQDYERFGSPLEDSLDRRYQLVCAALDRRMQRKQKMRQATVILGTFTLLLLLVTAAAYYFALAQAKDTATRLQMLVAARRVSDTERLLGEAGNFLKRIPSSLPPLLNPAAGMKIAIEQAQPFVAREKEFKRALDQKLEALRTLAGHGFSNTLEQVAESRAGCAEALERVAPEFKAEAESQLDALDKRWQDHLAALQPEYNAYFAKLLTNVEIVAAGQLNLTNGFERVTAALPTLRNLLTDLEKHQGGIVRVEPGLTSRFHDLTNQFSLWQVATERLLGARSLEDYVTGLRQLMQSSLLAPAQQEFLGTVLGLKDSPSELLGALLLPGQPQVWESLAQSANASPTFRPSQPNDVEKETYFKVRDDKNVQEIYSYYLVKHEHTNNPVTSHFVFTRGRLGPDRSGGMAGIVYDPTVYLDHSQFERHTYSGWGWEYSDIKTNGLIKESQAFQDLQLGDLIDPNTGNYQKSVLQLLDQLCQDRETSPIFRAYLSLRLFEMAELRPLEWGLYWCPGAAMRIQSLKDLGAGNLRSGDWLVPNQFNLYQKPLTNYFEQARTNSLEKQARFFLLLTHRACEAGFDFAGFADANGTPVVNQANAAGLECWGWGRRSRAPALVLRRTDSTHPWQKLDALLPFTPLFVFREDRRTLLKGVSEATLYPSQMVVSNLPPLFSGL